MAKKKTVFSCTNCGSRSGKWMGRCPQCGEYNTFTEETVIKDKKEGTYRKFTAAKADSLKDIETGDKDRLVTGVSEVDRVFGGGIVKGSICLVGGEPGVGKSTLALLIAQKLAESGNKVLYVSGEESAAQIKLRADRMGITTENLLVAVETGVENIVEIIKKEKPSLAVVDSIQTVYKEDIDSVAGSVAQVRESCAHLLYSAKNTGVPIIIIGHVTKEGMIAGPKMLEHMVDAVIYFEAEKNFLFKILRAAKNRFGSTNEIGIFEMTSEGIREVKTPSRILLENLKEEKTGSAIVSVLEGTRPLMLEIQSLTARRNFGMPQRTVTGVDYNRFLLIVAILDKKLGLNMENQDVFMNVAGGIKVFETAADLGIAAAIYSGFREIPVSTKTVFIGELGLDGEVRPVPFMAQRASEAERLGFTKCVVPVKADTGSTKMDVVRIDNLKEIKNIID